MPHTLTDAAGRRVTVPDRPRRIVSLVPSQTELLAALDLDDAVVGLTRFCERPAGWKAAKTIVGGTKQVHVERARALRPDLVLANREENTPAMVEALAAFAPVVVTDVADLSDARAMIRLVGRLTGRAAQAAALADTIAARFGALPAFAPLRAAYLIWRDPLMTVGHDTFIHAMLRRAGAVNVFGDRARYPTVTRADLRAAAPDVVLLASEPYPFDAADAAALRADLAEALPHVVVRRVDGQPFSWYGARLADTPAYLRRLRADLDAARAGVTTPPSRPGAGPG
jgi:ABC-type Fe3+-hydroxamate transport system substrate-binding protein